MHIARSTIVTIAILTLGIHLSSRSYAQEPLLQVTAPTSGSVATEGQTVTITVSADASVQGIQIVASEPLLAPQATSTPNEFTLTVPTGVAAGIYNVTAVGTNASGPVDSAPVAIDVEPQFVPTSIVASPGWLVLNSVGDQMPIRVIGSFGDGSTLDMTGSRQTVYTTNNTQVATVSSSGMITAVGPGQTPCTPL